MSDGMAPGISPPQASSFKPKAIVQSTASRGWWHFHQNDLQLSLQLRHPTVLDKEVDMPAIPLASFSSYRSPARQRSHVRVPCRQCHPGAPRNTVNRRDGYRATADRTITDTLPLREYLAWQA